MSTIVAAGYPREFTAALAGDEVHRLAQDLVVAPDAIAVVRRDREGEFHVTTNHRPNGGGATWGMFWNFLFGVLFLVPVCGITVGAGLGALLEKVEHSGIDEAFQQHVRDMMQPGTSVLFLVLDNATPDRVIAVLEKYGGTVLTSALADKARADLQHELHGTALTA